MSGPQARWYCHECHSSFREPYLNGGNDLPLCPICRSDVVEKRESDPATGAPDDGAGWFRGAGPGSNEAEGQDTDLGGGSARSSFDSPPRERGRAGGGGSGGAAAVQGLLGSFRPPSGMRGTRGANTSGFGQGQAQRSAQAQGQATPATAAGELLSGLFGGLMGGAAATGSGTGAGAGAGPGPGTNGPRTRTFTWGSPGGGGAGGSASITFGTPGGFGSGGGGGNPFAALGGAAGGGAGFGTALFGPGVGDAARGGNVLGGRPRVGAEAEPRGQRGEERGPGARPRPRSASPTVESAADEPTTHWHVGEDERGQPIEYEVHAHAPDEEGIPVFDAETGEPNVRPYVPRRDADADAEEDHDAYAAAYGEYDGDGGAAGPFGRPPGLGRGLGQPQTMEEMLAGLMEALNDPRGPGMAHIMLGGPGGVGGGRMVAGNPGDYVFTQEGLDAIMEQMAAQGHRPPPPASETVIEGLPRVRLDAAALKASQYKDCSVCQDDFELGQEVIKVPCKHIFHPDCLVPWLQTNGTCPVCRFSLVSEEERQRAADQPMPAINIQNPQQNVPNPLGGLLGGLANLFGMGGGGADAAARFEPERDEPPQPARMEQGSPPRPGSGASDHLPGAFPAGSADPLGANALGSGSGSLLAPPTLPASRPPSNIDSSIPPSHSTVDSATHTSPGPSPLGATSPMTSSESASNAAASSSGSTVLDVVPAQPGGPQTPVAPYPNAIP